MEKTLVKERFLHFIAILLTCTILGYLTNDIVNGISTGIFMGIGFVIIGEGIIGNRKRKK